MARPRCCSAAAMLRRRRGRKRLPSRRSMPSRIFVAASCLASRARPVTRCMRAVRTASARICIGSSAAARRPARASNTRKRCAHRGSFGRRPRSTRGSRIPPDSLSATTWHSPAINRRAIAAISSRTWSRRPAARRLNEGSAASGFYTWADVGRPRVPIRRGFAGGARILHPESRVGGTEGSRLG